MENEFILPYDPNNEIGPIGAVKQVLDWDNQVTLWHCDYVNHKLAIKVKNGVFRGFKIDVTKIQKIRSLQGFAKLALIFAYADDLDPTTPLEFTIIVAGLDSSNNLLTNCLYDYLDPCPSKCPNNLPCPSVINSMGQLFPYEINPRLGGGVNDHLPLADAIAIQCRYAGNPCFKFPSVNGIIPLTGILIHESTLSLVIGASTNELMVLWGIKPATPRASESFTLMIGSVDGNNVLDRNKLYEYDENLIGGNPHGITGLSCL
jgi:hypothetical protein